MSALRWHLKRIAIPFLCCLNFPCNPCAKSKLAKFYLQRFNQNWGYGSVVEFCLLNPKTEGSGTAAMFLLFKEKKN